MVTAERRRKGRGFAPNRQIEPKSKDLLSTWRRLHIFPGRVHFLNERDFLGSGPTFQLLFAGDRAFDVVEELVINKLVDLVLLGEALEDAIFGSRIRPPRSLVTPI